MNHRELTHLWAHKKTTSRKCGNMFIDGDTIYSYGRHFPIARHYSLRGEQCVLFTTRSYSVSTSKHIAYTRYAIPSSVPVFMVDDPSRKPNANTIKDYQERIDHLVLMASRARVYTEFHLTQARDLLEQATKLANGLRVKPPVMPDVESLKAKAKKQAAAQKRAEAKAARDRLKREKAYLESWLDGQRLAYIATGFAYCRLTDRGDGPEIETTKGAYVPVDHVKRIMPLVLEILRKGESFTPNGRTIHLGHYKLDRIDTQGVVHIGCHRFQREEVERIATMI